MWGKGGGGLIVEAARGQRGWMHSAPERELCILCHASLPFFFLSFTGTMKIFSSAQ